MTNEQLSRDAEKIGTGPIKSFADAARPQADEQLLRQILGFSVVPCTTLEEGASEVIRAD